jgi:RNA polymerase sigma-70 factor, ECF subfamily
MIATACMTEQGSFHQTTAQIASEATLIKAAQSDPRQFAPLYTAYYKRILSFVYHRLESKDDAFDITAQVFYIALEKLGSYRSQGVPFSAWLFRIASNELNKFYRQKKLHRVVDPGEQGLEGLKQDLDEIPGSAQDEILYRVLESLDEEEMELIDMRFFEKRSFQEIAQIRDISESACKMRVYRILEKLKQTYKNLEQ